MVLGVLNFSGSIAALFWFGILISNSLQIFPATAVHPPDRAEHKHYVVDSLSACELLRVTRTAYADWE